VLVARRAAAVLAIVVLSLAAVSAASAKDVLVFFTTPSRGVGCVYHHPSRGAAFLRCDVAHVRHPAKRPRSCKLDYGSACGLSPRGHARRLCVGDTVFTAKARVLRYGHTRRLGPFRCTSRRSGLRCVNRAGHGFVISRARQRLF
jgi:hypothetical protein